MSVHIIASAPTNTCACIHGEKTGPVCNNLRNLPRTSTRPLQTAVVRCKSKLQWLPAKVGHNLLLTHHLFQMPPLLYIVCFEADPRTAYLPYHPVPRAKGNKKGREKIAIRLFSFFFFFGLRARDPTVSDSPVECGPGGPKAAFNLTGLPGRPGTLIAKHASSLCLYTSDWHAWSFGPVLRRRRCRQCHDL